MDTNVLERPVMFPSSNTEESVEL